jgi:hypothetical protein
MAHVSKLLAAVAAMLVCGGCGGGGKTPTASSRAAAPPAGSQLFTGTQPFTNGVSGAPVSDRSHSIIQALADSGGWGTGNALKIDFSIPLFYADKNSPRVQVVGSENYCFGGPDCDRVPARMPVPAGAYFEGSKDMSCDLSGNTEGQSDCHLLVAERDEHKLYEIYHGTKSGENIVAEGFFVWDLDKSYPETLRGDQCTSADAAGFPIAALLPTADEVASGAVNHPLRFILPNDRMRKGVYVRPATHAGAPDSPDPHAPPYGVRFRLKADFDESPYSTSEREILKALKTYGMLLSDGGEVPLTFADDRTSTAKWSSLGIKAESFANIRVDQFDVVGLGPDVPINDNCVRNR